jgi:hypothetical protein
MRGDLSDSLVSLIRAYSGRGYHLLAARRVNQESRDPAVAVGLKSNSKGELRDEKAPEAFRPEM